MTVQLKTTAVRKAVNSLIANADTNLPVEFIARGMDIDLESGQVTIKFKPNGQPDQKKTKKSKANSAPEASGLEFAKGEKTALRREYKANIADHDEVKANMFGKILELKGADVMIVGFENGKFRVRKENGKTVNGTIKAVLNALASVSNKGASVKKRKPTPENIEKLESDVSEVVDNFRNRKVKKTQNHSRGTKQSKSSGAKLVKTKVTGKNPYSAAKKKELEGKFKKAAKALMTKGLSPSLFWKPVQIGDKVYRFVAASVKQEKVRLLNVKSGKTTVMAVSAVFPLSN